MARRPRRANSTIERKIHFFRVDAGVDASGQPITYDPSPALQIIDRLPFTEDESGRYLVDEDGNAIGVWPEVRDRRTALRFCQVRRNGLPQVEQAGVVNDLNIADNAGLLEPVHVETTQLLLLTFILLCILDNFGFNGTHFILSNLNANSG